MSQITYIPKNDFNTLESTNNTTWYTKSGKPLKIWRKRGYTNSLGTSKSSKDYDCSGCSSNYIIGTEFKMLGKYVSPSSISANPKRDASGCISVDNTRGPVGTRGTGNVISFSGGSKIRSSVTFLNKKYYGNTTAYLQSRNLDYKSNTFKSKYPGVNYYDSTENYVVQEYNWPDDTELTSSLYKGKSCTTNGVYNKVYYKPNNQQYGVQGAVDSSSRVTRLKYNTMQKAAKFMGDKSNTKAECLRRNGIKTKC
tara:strand:+ start:5606 stop:6364 length:759 start_codon:yes stop_codon:yes gene_type:complete